MYNNVLQNGMGEREQHVRYHIELRMYNNVLQNGMGEREQLVQYHICFGYGNILFCCEEWGIIKFVEYVCTSRGKVCFFT